MGCVTYARPLHMQDNRPVVDSEAEPTHRTLTLTSVVILAAGEIMWPLWRNRIRLKQVLENSEYAYSHSLPRSNLTCVPATPASLRPVADDATKRQARLRGPRPFEEDRQVPGIVSEKSEVGSVLTVKE
jgi:hypothetical protein